MNLSTVLDLITDRETTTRQHADRLREQITTLTAELAHIVGELANLATIRATLRTLAAVEFTADDPTIASAPYQQILHILATAPAGMRAKSICLALGVEPLPKHVEGLPGGDGPVVVGVEIDGRPVLPLNLVEKYGQTSPKLHQRYEFCAGHESSLPYRTLRPSSACSSAA
ncbi:hypothetical protein [Micromonospora carbonacea]|uniref:hypothetical protein n=1 Tax=Micromonospora carbonacea TaxID=47853 RepID=UPI003D7277C1